MEISINRLHRNSELVSSHYKNLSKSNYFFVLRIYQDEYTFFPYTRPFGINIWLIVFNTNSNESKLKGFCYEYLEQKGEMNQIFLKSWNIYHDFKYISHIVKWTRCFEWSEKEKKRFSIKNTHKICLKTTNKYDFFISKWPALFDMFVHWDCFSIFFFFLLT